MSKRVATKVTITCRYCGIEARDKRRDARYCSKRCATQAWREENVISAEEAALGLRCTGCQMVLPAAAFSPSQALKRGSWCRACSTASTRAKRHGLAHPRTVTECLNCGVDISDRRAHAKFCSTNCSMKHWHAQNPGRQRWYMVKTNYGMTLTQFDRMLAEQGGLCAVCRCEPQDSWAWNIDHCHATDKIRGIVCPPCNAGMGSMRDDPRLLRAAADYLERAASSP